MRELPEHIEAHLGEIVNGSPFAESSPGRKVFVLRCGPVDGLIAAATLGLSGCATHGAGGRRIRHELFMQVAEADRCVDRAAASVARVASEIIRSREAALRGSLFRFSARPARFAVKDFGAFYAAPPIFHPPEFHAWEGDPEGPVAMVWLLPVSSAEAEHIEDHGWESFEAIMNESDEDLASIHRRSAV